MTMLTVAQAAARLGVTDKAVYAAIRAGKLTRYEDEGRLMLSLEEVKNYRPIAWGVLPAGRKAGRPRRKRGSAEEPLAPPPDTTPPGEPEAPSEEEPEVDRFWKRRL